jgi:hypothetical protein
MMHLTARDEPPKEHLAHARAHADGEYEPEVERPVQIVCNQKKSTTTTRNIDDAEDKKELKLT